MAAACSLSLFCISRRDTAVLSAAWRACSEQPDLRARFRGVARTREVESAVQRVPELAQRVREVASLVRGKTSQRVFLFTGKRVFEVCANTPELRGPCGQRIRLLFVQHVAHGHGKRVETVLNAQQQQRIGAIAVDGLGLQSPQAAKLQDGVTRVHAHGEQRGRQTRQQPKGRRRLSHALLHQENIPRARNRVIVPANRIPTRRRIPAITSPNLP